MKIRKAIIPAAGLGTRFLPATKAQPKAVEAGIEDILIITGRSKRAIEDHFDYSPELERELEKKGKLDVLENLRKISDMVNIQYIRQKEPRGLGHAVYCAHSFINDEPFAVLLGDDVAVCKQPAIGQLMDVYDAFHASVLGVSTVPEELVSSYGIVAPDPDFKSDMKGLSKVCGLVEKPPLDKAPSRTAIFGRYIITPGIFEVLARTKPGAGGEIQLTDALKELMQTEDMYALDFEGKRYDIGSKIGFLKATVDFALQRDDLKEPFMEFLKEKVKA